MDKLKIKVVGVGEGGAKAVGKMIAASVGMGKDVDFITIGNDENLLLVSAAKTNIFLNRDSTMIYKRITAALRGANVVVIVAGAGSTAAMKALPEILSCAKNQNATIFAFANRPFVLESAARKQNAEFCMNILHGEADTVFDVPTEKFFVFRLHQMQVSLAEVFEAANDVFAQGVDICLDMFAKDDSLGKWGNAAFGCGLGFTALEAVKAAVKFPLLDADEIKHASKIFVRVTGGNDVPAKKFIRDMIAADAKLFWRVDQAAGDKIFASIVFQRN